jgi:hypothetical protein
VGALGRPEDVQKLLSYDDGTALLAAVTAGNDTNVRLLAPNVHRYGQSVINAIQSLAASRERRHYLAILGLSRLDQVPQYGTLADKTLSALLDRGDLKAIYSYLDRQTVSSSPLTLPTKVEDDVYKFINNPKSDVEISAKLVGRYDLNTFDQSNEKLYRVFLRDLPDEEVARSLLSNNEVDYLIFEEADKRNIQFDAQGWADKYVYDLAGPSGLMTLKSLVKRGVDPLSLDLKKFDRYETDDIYEWLQSLQ